MEKLSVPSGDARAIAAGVHTTARQLKSRLAVHRAAGKTCGGERNFTVPASQSSALTRDIKATAALLAKPEVERLLRLNPLLAPAALAKPLRGGDRADACRGAQSSKLTRKVSGEAEGHILLIHTSVDCRPRLRAPCRCCRKRQRSQPRIPLPAPMSLPRQTIADVCNSRVHWAVASSRAYLEHERTFNALRNTDMARVHRRPGHGQHGYRAGGSTRPAPGRRLQQASCGGMGDWRKVLSDAFGEALRACLCVASRRRPLPISPHPRLPDPRPAPPRPAAPAGGLANAASDGLNTCIGGSCGFDMLELDLPFSIQASLSGCIPALDVLTNVVLQCGGTLLNNPTPCSNASTFGFDVGFQLVNAVENLQFTLGTGLCLVPSELLSVLQAVGFKGACLTRNIYLWPLQYQLGLGFELDFLLGERAPQATSLSPVAADQQGQRGCRGVPACALMCPLRQASPLLPCPAAAAPRTPAGFASITGRVQFFPGSWNLICKWTKAGSPNFYDTFMKCQPYCGAYGLVCIALRSIAAQGLGRGASPPRTCLAATMPPRWPPLTQPRPNRPAPQHRMPAAATSRPLRASTFCLSPTRGTGA